MKLLIEQLDELETALKGTLPDELRHVMNTKWRELTDKLNVKINEIEVVL